MAARRLSQPAPFVLRRIPSLAEQEALLLEQRQSCGMPGYLGRADLHCPNQPLEAQNADGNARCWEHADPCARSTVAFLHDQQRDAHRARLSPAQRAAEEREWQRWLTRADQEEQRRQARACAVCGRDHRDHDAWFTAYFPGG